MSPATPKETAAGVAVFSYQTPLDGRKMATSALPSPSKSAAATVTPPENVAA